MLHDWWGIRLADWYSWRRWSRIVAKFQVFCKIKGIWTMTTTDFDRVRRGKERLLVIGSYWQLGIPAGCNCWYNGVKVQKVKRETQYSEWWHGTLMKKSALRCLGRSNKWQVLKGPKRLWPSTHFEGNVWSKSVVHVGLIVNWESLGSRDNASDTSRLAKYSGIWIDFRDVAKGFSLLL